MKCRSSSTYCDTSNCNIWPEAASRHIDSSSTKCSAIAKGAILLLQSMVCHMIAEVPQVPHLWTIKYEPFGVAVLTVGVKQCRMGSGRACRAAGACCVQVTLVVALPPEKPPIRWKQTMLVRAEGYGILVNERTSDSDWFLNAPSMPGLPAYWHTAALTCCVVSPEHFPVHRLSTWPAHAAFACLACVCSKQKDSPAQDAGNASA